MHANKQRASVAQDVEDVFANVVTEGIQLGIGQRAGDKVEGEVEVGQGEEGEEELNELVDELDV